MTRTRRLFAGYLVVLHVAFAVLLVGPDFFVARSSALSPQPPVPSSAARTERARHPHRELDPFVPAGATLFLGDSITVPLPTVALAAHAVNYGVGGQRSDQLLDSLAIYQSMARAARVVVTIGTNDLAQGREDGIAARYDAILDRIPAPVVMSSVFPMDIVPHARVRAVVEAARSACARHPRCTFVDAYAAFTDGGVTRAGLLADGVHLTRNGYEVWMAALRPALAARPGNHP